MATFLELKTLVQGNVIDLPSTVSGNVGTYINRALTTLQNLHKFKVMEALSGPTLTTVSTRELLAAVPTGFQEARGDPYHITNTGVVRPMKWAPGRAEALSAFNVGDADIGPPQVLVDGDPTEAGARNVEVYPFPDGYSDWSGGEYRIYIPFWRYVTALSADGDTNWFTANAEEWLEFKATSQAFWANWDETRATLWERRAADKMREVINRDKMYRIGGLEVLAPHHSGAFGKKVRL
jgi:hypothetical protein